MDKLLNTKLFLLDMDGTLTSATRCLTARWTLSIPLRKAAESIYI